MSTISKALEKQRREQAREAGALPFDAASPEQAVLQPSDPAPAPPPFRDAVRSHPALKPRPATGAKIPMWPLALGLLVVAVGVGYFAGAGGGKVPQPSQALVAVQPAATPVAAAATPEQTPMVVRVEVNVKQETPNQPAAVASPEEHVLQENPLPPAPADPVEPAPVSRQPVREVHPQDIPLEPPSSEPVMGYIPPFEDSSPAEEAPRKRRSRSSAPDTGPLRLEGVMWSEKDPMAIINGEIVGEGKTINGATVKKINKTTVTVEIDGRETVLQ